MYERVVPIIRLMTLCADLGLVLTHQQATVVYKNNPLEDDILIIFKLPKEKKILCYPKALIKLYWLSPVTRTE